MHLVIGSSAGDIMKRLFSACLIILLTLHGLFET
jgi:hypothetical protein